MVFSIYAWITIITILVTFGILLFTKLRSDLVFLSVIGVLFVTGVLDVNEALSGFSSTTVAVVGVMFVVVAGLTYTGVLHWMVKNMLGRPKDYKRALLRLMIPVAVLSPFLNTTTVVAMFVGVVKMWARKVKMKPSQLLIPLCLAGNMGAVCSNPCATVKLGCQRILREQFRPCNGRVGSSHSRFVRPSGRHADGNCPAPSAAGEKST